MAVALQGTPSVYEGASVTSAVIPYPTGVTAGELLLVVVTESASTASTTNPGGWTLARAQNGPTSSPSTSVWYKIAAGTESGSVTFTTNATAGRVTGTMTRWSGVDNTTPMDATAVGANSGTASTFNTPTITTVTANAMLVHAVSINASSSADIDTPSGMTMVTGSTGTGRRQRVLSQVQATAGASGTKTFSLNPTTPTLQWAGITVAMRPAAGGAEAYTKAGDLSATGTLGAAVTQGFTAAGTLSTSGTLSATVGTNAFSRSGILGATGTLSATATVNIPGPEVIVVREYSLTDMFRLDLYDKNRNWIAPVGSFISLEGTKRFDNISDLSFTVKATHPRLNEMLTPGTRVRCRLRGDDFISGPIRSHDGTGPGVSGEWTFGVEDNFRVLRNFLIYQVPGGTMAQQSNAYNYTKTGTAEEVFKDIVTKNIQNRSYEPIIVPANLGRGGTVTAQARMAKVYNEMFPLLESMGLGVKIDMTPAGLVIDVYEPGVFMTTLSENSRIIRKWKYQLDAPEVTHVVVGGQGQGTARTFISHTNTSRENLWGDRIEVFADARDAELLDTYHERADEVLFDGQGGAGIIVTLAETENFKFGGDKGLKVGQLVTAKVAGGAVQVTDILREIDFSFDVEKGLKLTGKIGKITEPNALMAQAIATLGGSLAKLKASQ